jgi:hypothetical protein
MPDAFPFAVSVSLRRCCHSLMVILGVTQTAAKTLSSDPKKNWDEPANRHSI